MKQVIGSVEAEQFCTATTEKGVEEVADEGTIILIVGNDDDDDDDLFENSNSEFNDEISVDNVCWFCPSPLPKIFVAAKNCSFRVGIIELFTAIETSFLIVSGEEADEKERNLELSVPKILSVMSEKQTLDADRMNACELSVRKVSTEKYLLSNSGEALIVTFTDGGVDDVDDDDDD